MTLPYMENSEGVHVMTGCGGEMSLCGAAWDDDTDGSGGVMRDTTRRTVTCPECAEMLLALRKVRVGRGRERMATEFEGR